LEKKTGMLFCIRRPVAALRPPFNTTCSFWIPKWFLFFWLLRGCIFSEWTSQSLKKKTILEKKTWMLFLYPAAEGRHLIQLVHFEFLNGFFFNDWEVHLGKMKGYIFPKFQERSK
jgi:hypothetical protein